MASSAMIALIEATEQPARVMSLIKMGIILHLIPGIDIDRGIRLESLKTHLEKHRV